MKALRIAWILSLVIWTSWPGESRAAGASLASSYEEWSSQRPAESGNSTYLSAMAYLEKGIPKVQIGWADLEGQEIWARPVELTANGRFRPLQAGVLIWSGSGRAEYQEAEAALPASPNPRWIEVVLIQSRNELGEPKKVQLILDVSPNRAASAPARMTASLEN